MRRQINLYLKTGVAVLAAACMAATLLAAPQTAASNPKGKNSKTKAKSAAKTEKQETPKQDENAALKKELAAQQEQINKLLGMVEQLTERLNAQAAGQRAEATAPQPSKEAATVAAAKPAEPYPSMAKVASLSPILPASPAAPKKDSDSGLLSSIFGRSSSAPQPVPAQGGGEKLGPLATYKLKMGVTVFGDYGLYTSTGFGPQFLTQINQPGPYNAGFNSFDITRTYLNFFYSPTDAITFRVTPNLYRQVDTTAGAQANGNGASFGGSTNGNLTVRIKYAYVDFNTLFKKSEMFGKDKVTFGQTTNPWIDWEEGLYGYRFVNLVPWNFISLSSTYGGVKLHGPIEFNGKEYLDYDIGVFNTQSFHSLELTDQKQAMGRLTWYPVGTKKDRTGLSLTVFEDYGSNGKTPDTHSTPDYRFATVGSYQTTNGGYQVAGEFDLGRNAMSTGNLFSGVGPAGAPYASTSTLASDILAGDRVKQKGYAFFGHADIPGSPFTLFGMYQHWQPNTNISNDPFDFERFVAGIDYKFNKYLDLALDSQNLVYTKSQFTFPAGTMATGKKLASPIPNAVPGPTRAIFLNMQFNY